MLGSAQLSRVTLTGKQRRFLRGLGHALEPVVRLGSAGLTDAVTRQLDQALGRHELVKVRVGSSTKERARDLAERLAAGTGAAVAQVLGHTLLVYRPKKKDPKIRLPGGDAPVSGAAAPIEALAEADS